MQGIVNIKFGHELFLLTFYFYLLYHSHSNFCYIRVLMFSLLCSFSDARKEACSS